MKSETVYVLGSKPEESLSDSECDSDNELDDCGVPHVVVDGDSDEDDDNIQDRVWEDMKNYMEQRENVMGSAGPHSVTKQMTEIVDISQLFLNKEFVGKIVE
jgi:hypothetical protein